MAEKDYKSLYEKSLEKNRKLKKQVERLKNMVDDLRAEQLSCDIEPLKGELFGRKIAIVRIEGKEYVRAELWTTEHRYDGHLIGTKMPKTHTVFFRCDNERYPIPYFCREMDLDFVITQGNSPKFVLNPPEGHPVHLLIHGDVWVWESWNEEMTSTPQIEHDNYYLNKCAKSASEFVPVNSKNP